MRGPGTTLMTNGSRWQPRRRPRRAVAARSCLQLVLALLLACAGAPTAAQTASGTLLAGGPVGDPVGSASPAAPAAPTDSRQPSPVHPTASPPAARLLAAAPQPRSPPLTVPNFAAVEPAEAPASGGLPPPPPVLDVQPPQTPPPPRQLSAAISPAADLASSAATAPAPAPAVCDLPVPRRGLHVRLPPRAISAGRRVSKKLSACSVPSCLRPPKLTSLESCVDCAQTCAGLGPSFGPSCTPPAAHEVSVGSERSTHLWHYLDLHLTGK